MARRRLDLEMMRRGLAESREIAQLLIKSGKVLVSGSSALKPSRLVDASQPLQVIDPLPKYVSRAGRKLEAALETFKVEVKSSRCIDIGASTGGFTDCLLQNGAKSVLAVDVGRGQIHERLVANQRVKVLEQTDVRSLVPEKVGAPFEILTADLAFISLRTVMENLFSLVEEGSIMLLLVKPQFEAGKKEVDRGRGVIRDPEIWEEAIKNVQDSINAHDAAIIECMPSPVKGSEGNVEFFLHVMPEVKQRELEISKVISLAVEQGEN
jgi:23S rRNA (cytidine1920-2'-O)/16S rRNA (cytidine1409-2'-O)-methyltransferase